MLSHETAFVCECRIFHLIFNNIKNLSIHLERKEDTPFKKFIVLYNFCIAYSIASEKKRLPTISCFLTYFICQKKFSIYHRRLPCLHVAWLEFHNSAFKIVRKMCLFFKFIKQPLFYSFCLLCFHFFIHFFPSI